MTFWIEAGGPLAPKGPFPRRRPLPCVCVCACFRVRAHGLKAAPEQRAGGWVSEGPTWSA